MTNPAATFAQEAYAILRTRFADESFDSGFLSWLITPPMVKKTLHTLEKSGWIRRISKGKYACVPPDSIFNSMVQFRVPDLLNEAGRPYAYVEASAAEIWTDHVYIQRSWERSPYFVAVLHDDLEFWISYFRSVKVRVFVEKPEPALGESVVVKPRVKLSATSHEGVPVEPISAVVRYCEQHLQAFEFPLAYMKAKHGIQTKARIDDRILQEAKAAL